MIKCQMKKIIYGGKPTTGHHLGPTIVPGGEKSCSQCSQDMSLYAASDKPKVGKNNNKKQMYVLVHNVTPIHLNILQQKQEEKRTFEWLSTVNSRRLKVFFIPCSIPFQKNAHLEKKERDKQKFSNTTGDQGTWHTACFRCELLPIFTPKRFSLFKLLYSATIINNIILFSSLPLPLYLDCTCAKFVRIQIIQQTFYI